MMISNKLERLKPLVGVISFVGVSTALISFFGSFTEPMEIGKIFMSMFFLTFGGFKAYNLEGFKEAFKSYDILAEKSDVYATVYPFLELGLGVLYLSLIFRSSFLLEVFTHSSAMIIMAVGGIGVLNAIREGRDLQCACLGNVFNVPMTKVTLAEDLGMALMAGVMLAAIL
ncbi:MAG: hypothetical protein ACI8Z7_000368 [Candidatus Nanohaloarchaea archaeon]|jgi:hypothetical protein